MFINNKLSNTEHKVTLIQLPFPSQSDPLPVLMKYYETYFNTFRNYFPNYNINEGDLWEAPLWVAQLDGAIGREDTAFINLSNSPYDVKYCIDHILRETSTDQLLFFSPLAQNLSLAVEMSKYLMQCGYTTVLGGNMTELAGSSDFSLKYSGIARNGVYREIMQALQSGINEIKVPVIPGKNPEPLNYRPKYRLLGEFHGKVPLIRINASHGCLFGCTFCGDAWSKQLHLVRRKRLAEEVSELIEVFPTTKLVYIGDKTFGQSRESIENLKSVLTPDLDFKLIVQTHVSAVNEWVMDAMEELNVKVVEMGFETANQELLKKMKKSGGSVKYIPILEQLQERGFKTVLNVLGGLPYETKDSQRETIQFLEDSKDVTWLYNLYNFVPYPKTPIFPFIKDRIVDWDLANWREDQMVVFNPFNQSREASWDHFLKLVDTATQIILEKQLKPAMAYENAS